MTREEAIHRLKNTAWLGTNKDREETEQAVDMAIEALQEVQKHEETFEWCTDCKEYDKDNYCCHRWSKMIRNTVEELKEYSGLVRCKDCTRNNDGNFCDIAFFINDDGDGFCNCGERREP